MIVTNRHGLPPPLVALLGRDRYSRGASRISVTQLIDSPRISILKEAHAEELEIDVVDGLWAMFGTALHRMIEEGAAVDGYLKEERIFSEVNGWVVSGGIDVQHIVEDEVVLWDWKCTSAWGAQHGKVEWVRQLNLYAELLERERRFKVVGLKIGVLIRDWKRTEMLRDRDYPRAPFETVDIPIWTKSEREEYLSSRVQLHQAAHRAHEWDEQLPLCTPEEMWEKPTLYAAKKPGRVRASRIFEPKEKAELYVRDNPDHDIEVRPGSRLRCESYCEAAAVCDQFQAYRKGE